MSVEEFESLGFSEDSSLVLINGIIYAESGGEEEEVTKRNRHHARIELLVGHILHAWVERTGFSGKVFSGEVGCVLSANGLSVGIDVALFDNETLSQVSENAAYLTGPPILAVEILSPSDQIQSIEAKIQGYLRAGVKQVWVISPGMQSITIHSPNRDPVIHTHHSIIDGGSVLPGFSAATKSLLD